MTWYRTSWHGCHFCFVMTWYRTSWRGCHFCFVMTWYRTSWHGCHFCFIMTWYRTSWHGCHFCFIMTWYRTSWHGCHFCFIMTWYRTSWHGRHFCFIMTWYRTSWHGCHFCFIMTWYRTSWHGCHFCFIMTWYRTSWHGCHFCFIMTWYRTSWHGCHFCFIMTWYRTSWHGCHFCYRQCYLRFKIVWKKLTPKLCKWCLTTGERNLIFLVHIQCFGFVFTPDCIYSIMGDKENWHIYLKGYSNQWEIHTIYLYLYNILVVHSNCAQRSLINNSLQYNCTRNTPHWNQDAAILRLMRQWRKPRTSLAHARSNILCLSNGIWCIQYVADCLRHNHNY